MDVLAELRKVGRSYPVKAPPIPVFINDVGEIGHLENRRGLYVNSMLEHHVAAIVRDEERAEAAAREISNGRFGAGELLSVARLGSDSRDAIRAIKSMRGAITTWDNVNSAIASGKYHNTFGLKSSITTTANNWFSTAFRTAGNPGAAATPDGFSNSAPLNRSSSGAWPIPGPVLNTGEDLYLANIGVHQVTGTNIVLAVDLLYSTGSLLTTGLLSQAVSTSTLPRWTGGVGVMMTLEIITVGGAAGATPNVRITYVDQSGNPGDTGNISLGVNPGIAQQLLPIQDGPFVRLASGDFGVQSVSEGTFDQTSAVPTRLAVELFRPLVAIPTFAATQFTERSTQAQLGGLRKITTTSGAGISAMPFLTFYTLTSTTSTGQQTYLTETVWG